MARLYRRTDTGRKAWDTQDTRVPLESRRVLGLVGHDTDPSELRRKLGWSESAIKEILNELEELGLVRSVDIGPDSTDLDFTGKLFIEELRAAQRPDLDFTGSLNLADLRAAQKKSS